MIAASFVRPDRLAKSFTLSFQAPRSSLSAAEVQSGWKPWRAFVQSRSSELAIQKIPDWAPRSPQVASLLGSSLSSTLLSPALSGLQTKRAAPASLSIMATAAGAKQEAPFGAWKSPLTTELVTSGSLRLGQAQISDDGKLVWKEGRPSEAG